MVVSPLRRGLANTHALARRWTFGCLTVLAVFGCDDDVDSTVLTGELGSSQFFYECTTFEDVHCRNDLTSFPDVIAAGATFQLLPSLRSSLSIKPASPHLVSAISDEFRFVQPGVSAFLALGANGSLEDFVHLRAVPVDEIEVQNSFGQAITQVTLERGRELTLTAVPFGDGEELAGSLTFRWAINQESVAGVPRRGTEVILEGLNEGTALVRVDLNELSTTIEVTVTPPSIEPPDDDRDAGDDPDAGDAGLDAAPDASVLDASTDAASVGETSDATAESVISGDAEASTSPVQTSASADASTPQDAAIVDDAQVQAEAGDQ